MIIYFALLFINPFLKYIFFNFEDIRNSIHKKRHIKKILLGHFDTRMGHRVKHFITGFTISSDPSLSIQMGKYIIIETQKSKNI